jgi:hypothetical protein
MANNPPKAPAPAKKAPSADEQTNFYYLVEFNGYDGQFSNLVLSAQEYDVLTNTVALETVIFKDVLKLAEQDWQTSSSKNKAFPKDAITHKKVRLVLKTLDLSKATEKKKPLDDKLTARADAAAKRVKDTQDKMKESDEQKKRDDAKAKAAEGLNSLARKIFDKRMIEQLNKLSPGTNAPPAQAQTPAPTPTPPTPPTPTK